MSRTTAFWRKGISQYSGGSFRALVLADERWRGPVQVFDNRQPRGAVPGSV